jgi:hypothetical protein
MLPTDYFDQYKGPDLKRPTDFPNNLINSQHQEDYILVPEPVVDQRCLVVSII